MTRTPLSGALAVALLVAFGRAEAAYHDCWHSCPPSSATCEAAIDDHEGNIFGCANWGSGQEPVATTCEDKAGSAIRYLNCDDFDCLASGRLYCPTAAGVSFPNYSAACPGRNGHMAKVDVSISTVSCYYPSPDQCFKLWGCTEAGGIIESSFNCN